ncbi:unnamed protein product [Allacma fusca]|uniref:Transposase domain-containing protein n=1 Tax=Allacma fusca TaxID=39272 RepID=A0A8J2KRG4_9HEXA|nr:unnamed protein product [Allacma fusca]
MMMLVAQANEVPLARPNSTVTEDHFVVPHKRRIISQNVKFQLGNKDNNNKLTSESQETVTAFTKLHCGNPEDIGGPETIEEVSYVTSDCDNQNSDASTSNSTSSSESSSTDSEKSFSEILKSWSLKHQISHAALSELLSTLKTHSCFENLPKDPRTLLQTPRQTTVSEVRPGNYVHFGLKNCLRNVLESCDSIPSVLFLQINVDGIPVFKSSLDQFWPILGSIVNVKIEDIFTIGIYLGKSKPSNVGEYLRPFIAELTDLLKNDFEIKGTKTRIKLQCFVCDAPARAYLKCIKGHNGYHSCGKCNIKDDYNLAVSNTPHFCENSDFEAPTHRKGKPTQFGEDESSDEEPVKKVPRKVQQFLRLPCPPLDFRVGNQVIQQNSAVSRPLQILEYGGEVDSVESISQSYTLTVLDENLSSVNLPGDTDGFLLSTPKSTRDSNNQNCDSQSNSGTLRNEVTLRDELNNLKATVVRNFAIIRVNQTALASFVEEMKSLVCKLADIGSLPATQKIAPKRNFGFPFVSLDDFEAFDLKLSQDEKFRSSAVLSFENSNN